MYPYLACVSWLTVQALGFSTGEGLCGSVEEEEEGVVGGHREFGRSRQLFVIPVDVGLCGL